MNEKNGEYDRKGFDMDVCLAHGEDGEYNNKKWPSQEAFVM